MWEIDIARETLTEKYPNYEWYLLSSERDHTQMTFITLNSQSKLARVCLSNQKRHMTIEIYDLSVTLKNSKAILPPALHMILMLI